MASGTRLEGKVAIVTGGASGIGAETARCFAAEGARVVVADVQDELGEDVVAGIAAAGGEAVWKRLDVVDAGAWEEIVADTVSLWGGLHVLGNIAGVSGRDPAMALQTTITPGPTIEDTTPEIWERVMSVNVTGVYLGTRAAIPPMRSSGGGSIINISSICGLVGSFGNAVYHASKGAVRIFTKATAVQHAVDGIRANSIHPGFVDTPMTRPGHSNNEVARVRLAATPLGRFGTPRDIALGCLYLAGDESSWVTGSELVIDGGVTAQ
ncbi:MAG: glucose 1-dehydrogenase [Alphaproteobacteria bacterium]|nr:glucose 1-dehydrogenase [Alphaproteobacteria bacterium]